jgi:hypothetical protein
MGHQEGDQEAFELSSYWALDDLMFRSSFDKLAASKPRRIGLGSWGQERRPSRWEGSKEG